MKKIRLGIAALITTTIVLSGCSKQATEEECIEFVMQMDFKAFEKGKCEKYIEW